MTTFSQRKGLKPVKSLMQIDGIDVDLRNSLWNAIDEFYWQPLRNDFSLSRLWERPEPWNRSYLVKKLWFDYYKLPIDTLGHDWLPIYKKIRQDYFSSEWNEVYDLIEFVANKNANSYDNRRFMEFCNSILERELSGYRFVGGKITQITSETEISEIEKALDTPLTPINIHLKTALDLLSDRKSPDYRNSIKESISAVEAICKLVASNPKATLGDALKEIALKGKIELHGALRKAFDSLYGYTNDADGIRHASLDEPDLHFEDAKFMLVSCSAFVNYLTSKASKAGIKGF